MNQKIAIIGLGYVGLPLAVEFAAHFDVIGYDINHARISELKKGIDLTLEISDERIKNSISSEKLKFSSEDNDLEDCDYYIITVPTPVDKYNVPDFTPLIKASELVAKQMKHGSVIIFESTVYPGATEEICVPVLEKSSGMKYNLDFFVGYSPERINPGSKDRTLTKIIKIVSGSNEETADQIQQLYDLIIEAGTYKASSIKVAEAAKVMENVQRDVNIAVVNEMARIFNKLNIDTTEVLQAAGTKWNFINVTPGLVGGHCIGIDPYYLIQKAQDAGYHPEIMLAARRLNESMSDYVAQELIKMMILKEIMIKNSKVLILGITFKENCPDLRNTKVVDIIKTLHDYEVETSIYDPWVEPETIINNYGFNALGQMPESERYDAVLIAVAHDEFKNIDIRSLCKDHGVIYDIKSLLPKEKVDKRL